MCQQFITSYVVLFAALVISGCASNIKPYRADLPVNLEVISNIESVEAALHIHGLGKQCESAYMGSVNLDKNRLQLGINTEQPSLLVVAFSSTSFWGNSSGYIDYGITLVPGKAYRYEFDVSYIEDIYNIIVYEINRATGKRREMPDNELQNCEA